MKLLIGLFAVGLVAVGCNEEQRGDPVTWRPIAEQHVLDWGGESEHRIVSVNEHADWDALWAAVYGDRGQDKFDFEFRERAESAVDLRTEVAVAYFPGRWPWPEHRVEDLVVTDVSRSGDQVVVAVEWIPRCGEIGKYECDSDQKWHMELIAVSRADLPTNAEFVAIDQFDTRLTGRGVPPSPTPLPTVTPIPSPPPNFDEAALQVVMRETGLRASELIIGGKAWRTEGGTRVSADYKIFRVSGDGMYQVAVDLDGNARITSRPQ